MSEDRSYFRVTPGGRSDQVITEFIQEHQNAQKQWNEFCSKYGAKQAYAGDRLEGLKFSNSEQPKGWISPKSLPHMCFKPARKKPSMEAYNEMKALPVKPGLMQFTQSLGCEPYFSGRSLTFATFEQVGEVRIISMHIKSEHEPPDSNEIKASEYWKLKNK
jgi:hypothetical protein